MKMFYVGYTVLFIVGILLTSCKSSNDIPPIPKEPARFVCSPKGEFAEGVNAKTFICTDSETGIKYLYIWGGWSNGGPAMTRLWEK